MQLNAIILAFTFLIPSFGTIGYIDLLISFVCGFIILVCAGGHGGIFVFVFISLSIASFLQLGYTLYAGKIIDDFYWIAYFSANPNEAMSFIEALSIKDCLFYLSYMVLISVAYIFVSRQRKKNKSSQVVKIDDLVIYTAILTFIIGIESKDVFARLEKLQSAYPFNLFTTFNAATAVTKGVIAPMKDVQFQKDRVADIVLLIIGESVSKSRMQLYGYGRKTNPYLTSRNDLTIYQDALATGLNTQPNVKTLFTGKLLLGREKVDQDIFRLAKKAGFDIYYLDNNKYQNKDPIYLISSQSDSYLSINRIGETTALTDDQIQPDEVLTYPYAKILKNSNPKKLIILHMAGSHPSQSKRYPQAFSMFESYYDNSILYSDYLINMWIDMLKDVSGDNIKSAAIFVSDHGVKLPPGCGLGEIPEVENINYGADDRYFTNQSIPVIFWASDAFKIKNRDLYNSAVNNSTKKLDHRFLYSSLADLFGGILGHDEMKELSLFNKNMHYKSRKNTDGNDMDLLISKGAICK